MGEAGRLPPERVAELLEAGDAELIDVRTAEEHDAGHVPGDRRVPFDALRAEVAGRPDRTLIFYCRGGDRSGAAADAVAASGRETYSMEGGLLAWVEAGRPLEPEGGEVAVQSSLPPP